MQPRCPPTTCCRQATTAPVRHTAQSPNFPEERRFKQWALAFPMPMSGEYSSVSRTRSPLPGIPILPMTASAGTKADQPDHPGPAANAVGVPAAEPSPPAPRGTAQCWLLMVVWLLTAGNSSGQQGSPPAQSQPPDTAVKSSAQSGDSGSPFLDLLTADLKQAWKAYPLESLEGTDADWSIVRDPTDSEFVLICRGRMKGFLWTLEKWQDFEFTGEWKYPADNDGNSGILVHTQREDRIWPTAIQIQLHQPKAGSIFPGGDAVSDNMLEVADGLAKPINSWNSCRVVCQGGRISVEINGKRAGEVTGARPVGGHLALQSEGSEVHFRRLRIRQLTAKDAASQADKTGPDSTQSPTANK